MGPRTASSEHTRKRILDKAHRLFVDHGYHGTSMRRIAREAGVALVELGGRPMPDLIGPILPELMRTIQPFARGEPGAAPETAPAGSRLRPIPGQLLFRAFIGLFFSYYITDMFFSRVAASE